MKENLPNKMTSYERLMTAYKGGIPDRVPVIAFVRDWTALQVGFSIKEIMENVEKHVFSQYYCAYHFGYDSVFDLSGIHAEAEALGSKLNYSENKPPSIAQNIIRDYDTDLKNIKIFDPNKDWRLSLILEGVRRLKELCQGRIPVQAYMQAPFRLATMLRGDYIYRDIIKKKNDVHKLLEIAYLNQLIYGMALVNVGADIIQISDPTSSGDILSREQWLEFGYIYTKKLVSELKKTKVLLTFHMCGDTSDRLDTFVDLGIDAMSLDQKVDLGYARKVMGEKICIIGNVSPTNLMYNSPEEIKKESLDCIHKAGKKGNFVLAPGCGVGMETPAENIEAMVKIAKGYRY